MTDQWKIHEGWLAGALHILSPNCNPRPEGAVTDLVVVHGISLPPGQYGGPEIEALFTNTLDAAAHPYFSEIAHLEVSAHFLIRRAGEVVQFVSTDERAWHAGASSWKGREQCNDFSIGIELEGCDEEAYTDSQYDALNQLLGALTKQYPDIRHDAIVGHSDIAPGRKTDPGPAFDWSRLVAHQSEQ
ncbi:MAG: 1,6-anhydro-N-acetylmuramyl-L-alanine amidase AmpD [Congregibacter sp.]|nr:1,6-anhydro-N-acetylmuramyl-L-alanine amidase AmpD [Congregibacter sp.]